MMMISEDRAADLGFERGRCPRCRQTVYSDSGAFSCQHCGHGEDAAVREEERMRAACLCGWDNTGYDWQPGCPEHDGPDGSLELWLGQRGRARQRAITVLLDASRIIDRVMEHCGKDFLLHRMDATALGTCYGVLIPIQHEFTREILQAAL